MQIIKNIENGKELKIGDIILRRGTVSGVFSSRLFFIHDIQKKKKLTYYTYELPQTFYMFENYLHKKPYEYIFKFQYKDNTTSSSGKSSLVFKYINNRVYSSQSFRKAICRYVLRIDTTIYRLEDYEQEILKTLLNIPHENN